MPWLLPDRWRPRRVPAAHRTGRRGERLAARALRRAGFRILGRNLRCPQAEIDLLALEGRTLVVVEVKTTASSRTAAPRAGLGRRQRRRLAAAARWLGRTVRPRPRHVRVDLVTVVLGAGPPRATIHRGGGGTVPSFLDL